LKIGAFTAASNITGICLDVPAITALLHRYGALAFWDYATAAPYLKMDMNASSWDGGAMLGSQGAARSEGEEIGPTGSPQGPRPSLPPNARPNYKIDALYLSGHKLVGGPGTPGVLVVKKFLVQNDVPERPGGGTVFFVKDHSHRYLSNQVEREEGGTPDILGSIRLGLCFGLKERVGATYATERGALFAKKTLESFCSNRNIVVLGDFQSPRLPIFSFLIRHGPSFLHYNFVCALLNDLFGIQVITTTRFPLFLASSHPSSLPHERRECLPFPRLILGVNFGTFISIQGIVLRLKLSPSFPSAP